MNHHQPHTHAHKNLGYEIKEPVVRLIIVAIHNQSLHALDQNGKKIFSYDCATGRENFETPLGNFKIDKKGFSLEQAKQHESSEFAGAAMPYPMYLDVHRGIAIHGSGLVTSSKIKIPGIIGTESYLKSLFPSMTKAIGSHGCIRLAVADALELYLHTSPGTEVVVRKFWIDESK